MKNINDKNTKASELSDDELKLVAGGSKSMSQQSYNAMRQASGGSGGFGGFNSSFAFYGVTIS